MREQVRIFIAACFYYSGLIRLARRWAQRPGQRLIILNYHSAIGGNLRSHLLYLHRHYRMLHLEEALKELYTPKKVEQARDRRTPLVLTFDDGYRDNYTHVFPLVRELQVPITIFLVPGYVESGDHFWWLEAERLTRHTLVDKAMIEGHTYYLKQAKDRVLLARAIDDHLRHAASVAEREAFLTTAQEALAVPSSSVTEEEALALPLTWAQIREMEESGWVSFGAHTMHHPILSRLTDPAEILYEIDACRTALEQGLGHPVYALAYPFGQPEEVGEEAARAAERAAYNWVVTTVHGINTPRSSPHHLLRIYGDASRHLLVMAAETSGVWKLIHCLGRTLKLFGKNKNSS